MAKEKKESEKSRDGKPPEETAEQKKARQTQEMEDALPEPKPMGDKRGTIPLPVGAPTSAKKNVEVVVELTKAHTSGAGQLDINVEHLLLVRAEYLKGIPQPKRDGNRDVIGFKYIQQLRPTWVESLEDYLTLNGLKIVRADEEGESVPMDSLSNIEGLRQAHEGKSALD